ncbi:MAG TPA: hypothetical protein VG714_05525 [Acidobacteriaceae bacterium]|nr:hypothetical protein [Acidobacteriaceae bacterium]
MILRTSIIFLTFIPGSMLIAQVAPAASGPARSPAVLPSATLQPSLDILRTAIGSTHADHWKGSSAIRNEAATNLHSIQNDLESTLPGLLAVADTAPGSAAKLLPAYRNADALYDVLLRVVMAARLSAPSDELSALDQALSSLEDSRRALGDQLQQVTQAQESQIGTLQAALKAVPPPAPPPPPAAPVKCPTTPVRKRSTRTSTAKPSATTSTATHK